VVRLLLLQEALAEIATNASAPAIRKVLSITGLQSLTMQPRDDCRLDHAASRVAYLGMERSETRLPAHFVISVR
jgi:hypothetical protein